MSGKIMVDMETARKCALIAAKAADSKKASDIMVQEVGEVVSSTDFFVISTAVNNRQPEARDFYRLETLWNDAPIIDLKEAGITDVEYSDRIAKILGEKQD